MTFDPKQIPIAVALVRSVDGQLTIAWNDNWQSFVLPMTKIHSVGPVVETAEQAAVRAAAEVLHVPCRVVPGKSAKRCVRCNSGCAMARSKTIISRLFQLKFIHNSKRSAWRDDRYFKRLQMYSCPANCNRFRRRLNRFSKLASIGPGCDYGETQPQRRFNPASSFRGRIGLDYSHSVRWLMGSLASMESEVASVFVDRWSSRRRRVLSRLLHPRDR